MNEAINSIDWNQDKEFCSVFGVRASDDFKEWWAVWYGPPKSGAEPGSIEDFHYLKRYWKRCSLALAGWLGHEEFVESQWSICPICGETDCICDDDLMDPEDEDDE